MEEEARVILGDAAAREAKSGAARHQAAAPDRDDATNDPRQGAFSRRARKRVVLIIAAALQRTSRSISSAV